MALKNILDKPEDSLKRDSVLTDSTFYDLTLKKLKSKDFYLHRCAKGILNILPFFKMKENNKILKVEKTSETGRV